MHMTCRNVNDAFREMVSLFKEGAFYGKAYSHDDAPVAYRPSRNGRVLMIDEPVTVTYTHPRERVLFNAVRDANPFFHLYESLWMLAGRNDVAPLAYYNSKMKDFSDDGRTFNGAYGYRWRRHEIQHLAFSPDNYDQLDILVSHLKADPNSRRAVLQMWNVEDDLLKIGKTGNRIRCPDCHGTGFVPVKGDDATRDCPRCNRTCWVDEPGSKDVCCNLSVMFSLRQEEWSKAYPPMGITASHRNVLDMTVTNRSNDMVWGMLGANYVHFTILQEYMAARLGAGVGKYHHFTNNLHVYAARKDWKPEALLKADDAQPFGFHVANGDDWGAQYRDWATVPLVKDPAAFEQELPLFAGAFNGEEEPTDCVGDWDEPFFDKVGKPMLVAFRRHKQRRPLEALDAAHAIAADDWRLAATAWLQRRVK
jgi:thymidylate synthase